jgi:tripartite-type tricarboxylate transporter receptor subunit TctC
VPPFFIASILAVASLAVCASAPAQDYPTRPIRLIIPLGPGGGGESYPATWFGLFAPSGTPKPIIVRLAHEVARIVDERDFRQRMYIDRAVEPSGVRLEEFARFIRDERETAERIVRESGLQPK